MHRHHHHHPHSNGNGLSVSQSISAASTAAPLSSATTETSLSIPSAQIHSHSSAKTVDNEKMGNEAFCCCGFMKLRHACFGIAIFELFVFGYLLSTRILDLAHTHSSPDNDGTLVGVLLSLLSFLLASTAALLLIFGVFRRSPILLIPHLLMQTALLIAHLVIIGIILFFCIAGFEFHINAVFIEASPEGDMAMNQMRANHPTPIRAKFYFDSWQYVIVAFFLIIGLVFCIQLWCFRIVLRTYTCLHSHPPAPVSDPPHHHKSSLSVVPLPSAPPMRPSPPAANNINNINNNNTNSTNTTDDGGGSAQWSTAASPLPPPQAHEGGIQQQQNGGRAAANGGGGGGTTIGIPADGKGGVGPPAMVALSRPRMEVQV